MKYVLKSPHDFVFYIEVSDMMDVHYSLPYRDTSWKLTYRSSVDTNKISYWPDKGATRAGEKRIPT